MPDQAYELLFRRARDPDEILKWEHGHRQTRDEGMLIEWDVGVTMRDGARIFIDVFRPGTATRSPSPR
jgi:predicted acyl esterase